MRVDRQTKGQQLGEVSEHCTLFSDLRVVIREPRDAAYSVRAIFKNAEGTRVDPNVLEAGGGTTSFTYRNLRAGDYSLLVELLDPVETWKTNTVTVQVGQNESIQVELCPRRLILDRNKPLIAVDEGVQIKLFEEAEDPMFTKADPKLTVGIGHDRLALFKDAELSQALALDGNHAVVIPKAEITGDRRIIYGKGRRGGPVEMTLKSGDYELAKSLHVSGPLRFVRCVMDPTTVPQQMPEGAGNGWTKAQIEAWLASRRFDAAAAKADNQAWSQGWDEGNVLRACSMHVDGMTGFFSDIGYMIRQDSPGIRAYNWCDAGTPTGLTVQQECDLVWDMKAFLESHFERRGDDSAADWNAVLEIEINDQGVRQAATAITVEFGFYSKPDSVAGTVYSRFRKCLSIALTECSNQARALAAAEYRRLMTAALNDRIAGRSMTHDCTRQRCIERCAELAMLMAKGQHAALGDAVKYTEVTIDIVRADLEGVFYAELDSNRDKRDGNADIDRGGWLVRKKAIAKAFAESFTPILPVFKLTSEGLFVPAYTVSANALVEV